MRDIKFRAWDKVNKRMITAMSKEKICMSVFTGDTIENYVALQYIGLKDKNGKEIYEGDILKFREGDICEVVFKHGCFEAIVRKNGTIGYVFVFPRSEIDNLVEVIGNVYENEKLLKEIKEER